MRASVLPSDGSVRFAPNRGSRPRVGSVARSRIAAAALGLPLAVAVLFFGCGRVPPEAFWEASAEDSAAIQAVVDEHLADFLTDFDQISAPESLKIEGLIVIDTSLTNEQGTRLQDEMEENPYRQRFRVDALQHVFEKTDQGGYFFEQRLYAHLDTLREDTFCTVLFVESIPGYLDMHVYEYTQYLKDTLIFPSPGETLVLRMFDSQFSDTSFKLQKEFLAHTSNGLFLQKESGEWKFKKTMGGSRFYTPNPNDAPYLLLLYLKEYGAEEVDTIWLRPDTLENGIQRLYAAGELPTYAAGETLQVQISPYTDVPDADFYAYLDGKRYDFRNATTSWEIPLPADIEPGIHRLYVEQTPIPVYYEASGKPFEKREPDDTEEGRYVSAVWGIAINIEGGE
ncbi:MAG: hypothetical protein JSU73_12585 [candidate division WOR-3 bacterium]|nr:MAG: hypothetical protein JSU73_12585 [candidate division WOR-3 bacterium]